MAILLVFIQVMEHITDPDFSDPFVMPGVGANTGAAFVADPNGLEMLMGMGFTDKQATKALKETQNNIERAADWIFSHQDELDAMEVDEASNQGAPTAAAATPKATHRDGESGEWLRGSLLRNKKLLTFVLYSVLSQSTSWWHSSRTWALRRKWATTCATS